MESMKQMGTESETFEARGPSMLSSLRGLPAGPGDCDQCEQAKVIK
jgi:hypothetical protein